MAEMYRLPNWQECELPSIPQLILCDELDDEGTGRLEFLRRCLWEAFPDARRRSKRGINRMLQQAFPDMGIDITFTEQLCDVWMRAGAAGLIAASRQPWTAPYGRIKFAETPKTADFAFRAAKQTESDVFYCSFKNYLAEYQNSSNELKYWKVAAQNQFAKYTAFLVSPEEPDWLDADSICLWQFRVPVAGSYLG